MTPTTFSRVARSAGGRRVARRLWPLAIVLATAAAASAQPVSPVSVREEGGIYRVAATFETPQPAAIAYAVLTDFEGIPRFVPDVRSSRIVERGERRLVVEQEAVARVMFFSKRVRLTLDVQTEPTAIRFRDRLGESFRHYEGAWTIREVDGRTRITYELAAQPAFEVPEFILTRLLRRDADRLIVRLQGEMSIRTGAAGHAY